MVAQIAREQRWGESFSCTILTDLSRDTLLCGATDAVGILELLSAAPNSQLRFLPSLHAKAFVADESIAIVTSGNMTESGLWRNIELGIEFSESHLVRVVREHVVRFASLGSLVSADDLRQIAQVALELQELRRKLERSVRLRLRREFTRRLDAVDQELLRVRVAGRAPHAIFGEAIELILADGPATTQQLHIAIKQIHCDLCDDTVDRVIDGKHFGKKWKHAVRTAQQHLKRNGRIELVGQKWRLCRSLP
jgi:hypothetical protein